MTPTQAFICIITLLDMNFVVPIKISYLHKETFNKNSLFYMKNVTLRNCYI